MGSLSLNDKIASGTFIQELSARQELALNQMRNEFKDVDYPEKNIPNANFVLDDVTLSRFLIARDFDFGKTKYMLYNHLKFRKDHLPEQISLLKDENLRKILEKEDGFWKLAGTAKNGSIIQYIDVGKYHPEYFPDSDMYCRAMIYQNQLVRKRFAATGWKVDRNVVFYDLTEFSYFTHGSPRALNFCRVLSGVVLEHYPEQLDVGILYNAPAVFNLAWSVIRRFINKRTADRIVFVYKKEQLLEYIDADQLYEKYGGTRKEEYPSIVE